MQLIKSNYKLLKTSSVVYWKYNLFYIYSLFYINKFVIFINFKQFKNKEMYNLKNELNELKIESKIILKNEVKKIFTSSFYPFLGCNLFCVFINDIKNFNQVYNILLLNKIKFFYSFNKVFSNFIDSEYQRLVLIWGKVFITINFIIIKLIWNIILFILYFILSIIKYINLIK